LSFPFKILKEEIPFPIGATAELTYRCNLKCIHCYVQNSCYKELGFEEWKSAIEVLRKKEILFLTFTGGEPFIRKDAIKIMEFASEKDMALRIFTNGTLITEEICRRLKNLKILEVEMSIYGDENVHDSITGEKGSFKRLLNSLELLRKRGLKVNLKMVVMKGNQKDIEKVNKIGESFGSKTYFDFFITPRDDGDISPTLLRLNRNELFRALKTVKNIFNSCSVKDYEELKNRKYLCSAGVNFFNINPQGIVSPCIQLRIPCGNIIKDDFEEIWNGKQMKEIRSVLKKLNQKCGGCLYLDFCHYCIGVNLLENKSFQNPSKYSCLLAKVRMDLYNKENFKGEKE